MKPGVQDALDAVEMTYADLNEVANEMTANFFEPINKIIEELRDVNELSNDMVRDYMIRLALNSYSLGEIKEKSALKAECAEALRKEQYAKSFREASGSAAIKENEALLGSNEQVIVEALYNLISSLFKTKLDEAHRVVAVLQSVLMSRNMEAKLTTNVID